MNLREAVFKGGAYLVTRHILGIIVSLANLFILTRLIGPRNYGLYAASVGLIGYLGYMGRLGIDVYLMRRDKEPSPETYNQAFTILFCSGIGVMILGVAATPLLQRWYQDSGFIRPFWVMLGTLPLYTLAAPAMSKLERNLDYRTILTVDLAGQIAFCIVSFLLAASGMGVWAPVAGYILWQLCVLAGVYARTHLTPRFCWSSSLVREMVGYGIGYSASLGIWQLRSLVNPLIVGRYAGPEGVGFVALTIRLTEQLGFIRSAAWQLSIPALARLQDNYQRLKKSLEEAMFLQVLLIGLFLAGFALLSPWLFPLLFGERWQPVLKIFPFISLGILLNVVFNMHSSVLYVLKRNKDVALFHLFHIFLFSTAAFLLVPRIDILGYGLAEILALLSYIVIHIRILKFFHPSYLEVFPWVISFIPPLFATLVPDYRAVLLWIPFLIVLFFPKPRKQALRYFNDGIRQWSKP